MRLNPISKYVAGVGSVALLSMAMSGTASAVTFNVTSTVQNALTVSNVADMNLGTIFATTASDGMYRYMTLGADGTMSASQGSAGLTLLGLGGQSAAEASVAVGTNTAFTVTLPAAEPLTANQPEATGEVSAAATNIPLVSDLILVAAADPTVARFQLINFTVGTVTGGTAGANCTILDGADTDCTLTPDFGATAVGFNVGATIVTDLGASIGNRDVYQAATYTGTFDVTATY